MKVNAQSLTRTAILLALALAFQAIRLSQVFTGPAVNAVLFIAAAVVGKSGGVFIGLITPWIALSVGILKPVLAPAVPFIMLGNALLVIVYSVVRRWNEYAGVGAAAVVKFLVLFVAVRFILSLNPVVSVALQFPQLLTALGGGAVAIALRRVLRAVGIWKNEREG